MIATRNGISRSLHVGMCVTMSFCLYITVSVCCMLTQYNYSDILTCVTIHISCYPPLQSIYHVIKPLQSNAHVIHLYNPHIILSTSTIHIPCYLPLQSTYRVIHLYNPHTMLSTLLSTYSRTILGRPPLLSSKKGLSRQVVSHSSS